MQLVNTILKRFSLHHFEIFCLFPSLWKSVVEFDSDISCDVCQVHPVLRCCRGYCVTKSKQFHLTLIQSSSGFAGLSKSVVEFHHPGLSNFTATFPLLIPVSTNAALLHRIGLSTSLVLEVSILSDFLGSISQRRNWNKGE